MIDKFLKENLFPLPVQDYGYNGIQVETHKEIDKIAFAVDVSVETIEAAINADCCLLIVHHGLLWGRELPVTGNYYRRLKLLLEHDLGLIAYHLPLDGQQELGNNVTLLKTIGATDITPCSYHKGFPVGYAGKVKIPLTMEEIARKLNIPENSKKELKFHNKKIQTIGIVSGGGGSYFDDFLPQNIDLFITGEQDHILYHKAKESNVNILFCGHYYSEIWGIKELQNYIQRNLQIETIFLDFPTGL